MDKLLMKKKKDGSKELSDNEKDAKMSVVKALQSFAAGEMSKKMGAAGKSGPAAEYLQVKKQDEIRDPDEDKQGDYEDNEALGDVPGQHEAIDGAHTHEPLMGSEEASEDEESPEEEAEESPEEEKNEHDDMSEQEIDAKLKSLMAAKAKKRK